MASAMSGSRGRASKHPRRASLVLARLPLLVLLAFVLANMNHPVKAENETDPPGEAEEEEELKVSLIIESCDDLPDERTEVFGVVAVMGDILCKENRVSNTSPFCDASFCDTNVQWVSFLLNKNSAFGASTGGVRS